MDAELFCDECGEPVKAFGNALHHVKEDGSIDYEMDRDHKPESEDFDVRQPDPADWGGVLGDSY